MSSPLVTIQRSNDRAVPLTVTSRGQFPFSFSVLWTAEFSKRAKSSMIIVDTALAKREAEGNPIRVGLVGAGFMGGAVARQILTAGKGLRLSAVASRKLEPALAAYKHAGIDAKIANTKAELEAAIASGTPVVTEDAIALAKADGIDVVFEITGSIEHALTVILTAIDAGKHVVQMNAEIDGTVGPILKKKADAAGVMYTFSDGDQPGVQMNLYRFVKGIGVTPVLCGNIKGLHDPYRNPTTQEGFAKKWGQKPAMVASFADGTKISFEQAVVANGTGMRVARRGMLGPDFSGGNPGAPQVPLEETVPAFKDASTSTFPPAAPASSITWWAPVRARACSSSGPSTTPPSSTTSTSTSSAPAPTTPSTCPTTFATSRRPRRSPARCCSAMPSSPR